MDIYKLDKAHAFITEKYSLIDHLGKLSEEMDELDSAMAPIFNCPASLKENALHLIEEIVDVQIVIDHVLRKLTEDYAFVPDVVKWMHEYKTARQMVRILINDETYGSTKCPAES